MSTIALAAAISDSQRSITQVNGCSSVWPTAPAGLDLLGSKRWGRGLMVALKSERRIFLWRVSPHASPTEAPVDVKFEQIFDIPQSRVRQEGGFRSR